MLPYALKPHERISAVFVLLSSSSYSEANQSCVYHKHNYPILYPISTQDQMLSCQEPAWWGENKNLSCPFGTSAIGDITIPHDLSFGTVICVIYSYLVYVLGAGAVLEMLLLRNTRTAIWCALMALMVSLTEMCIKPLLAWPRPGYDIPANADADAQGSCNLSCGAPSTHGLVAYMTLLVYVLDASSRLETHQESQITPPSWRVYLSCVPFTGARRVHWSTFFKGFVKWMFLVGPIPLCRIVLHDHSAPQMLLSLAIAVLGGSCLWFMGMRFLRRFEEKEGTYVCFRLCFHDFFVTPPFRLFPTRQRHATTNDGTDSATSRNNMQTLEVLNCHMQTSFVSSNMS